MEVRREALAFYCQTIQNSFSIEIDVTEFKDFLTTVGFLNPAGRFYKERFKKFNEVVNFSLHIIKALGKISHKNRVVLLECGCGRSYLSFFLNFFLLRKKKREVYFIGIDQNPILVEKCNIVKEKLGSTNMNFSSSKIIDFQPPNDLERVHGVFSLHACDTATDETVAKGILLNARYIMVAPCCQREIVRQVNRALKENKHPFRGFMGKYFLKEKLSVALTEIFRALILEAAGYKVDVFAFVSSKYTPKNTMIRAKKNGGRNFESLNNYQLLKEFFHLKPKIEEYLPSIFGNGENIR